MERFMWKHMAVKNITFNYEAFDNVRKSPGVMDFLEEKGQEIAEQESGNYEVKTYKKRGAVRIQCADRETEQGNLHDNRLVKAARRKRK